MRRLRIVLALALLAATAGSFGCAFGEVRWSDPLQREFSLEEAQHRYTVLVRWNDSEKASKFVDPEQRSDYLASFPNFREIRFTEYESDELTMDPDRQTATLDVRYFAYTPTSPIETIVTETQEWYRDAGVGNNWHVRSTFSGLDALVAEK